MKALTYFFPRVSSRARAQAKAMLVWERLSGENGDDQFFPKLLSHLRLGEESLSPRVSVREWSRNAGVGVAHSSKSGTLW